MVTDPVGLLPAFDVRMTSVLVDGSTPVQILAPNPNRIAFILGHIDLARMMVWCGGGQPPAEGLPIQPERMEKFTFKDLGGVVQQAWTARQDSSGGQLVILESLFYPERLQPDDMRPDLKG